jgi:hypothetical protein
MPASAQTLSATARSVLASAAEHPRRMALPPKLPAAAQRAVIRSLLKAGLLEEVPAPDGEPQFTWRHAADGNGLALRVTVAGCTAVGAEYPTDTAGAPDAAPIDPVADPADPQPIPAGKRSLRRAAQAVIDAWDSRAATEDTRLADAVEQLRSGLATRLTPRLGAPRPARTGTKQAAVVALLRRAEGASGPQITEATGWAPHTVRGFLAGLQKKGVPVAVLERVRQAGPNKQGAKGSFTIYRIAD